MKRRDFLRTAGVAGIPVIAATQLSSCDFSGVEKKTETKQLPKVFMTKELSGQGLMALYKALQKPVSGKVAIKLHMGEPGNTNYLRPHFVQDLCKEVNGSLVDCNVYYDSPRATSEGNMKAAHDHGYTFAPVDILDSEGEVRFPIEGGKRLKEAIFGSHIMNYDWIISVAHFKGHLMAGYGGTFKNLAIGLAAVAGKKEIHTHGPGTDQWSCVGQPFLEKIIEYNKCLIGLRGDKMIYFNVLNNLSIYCDCDKTAPHPTMPDIGILASTDPVALDKASLDQIYARPEAERKDLVTQIESCFGVYQVIYAEQSGLGSQQYELVKI
jgi:uncharacterized Fe-S center protein